MVEGPAKRQRVDENSEPNRQSVTDEQKAIVEKNRQVALARRSAQTEQRIRQNREAALERRRQRLELLKGSQECQDVLQNISNQSGEDLQQPTSKEDDAGKQEVLQNISKEKAQFNQSGEDLQHPTSKEDEDRQEHALLNISQKQAQFNQSGEDLQHPTSKEDEDRQEHALLNISQKQAEVNQSGEEISQQDAATLAMAQDHQPTHESSAVEDMEESSECAFELTSGSESSLSSRESSLSSSESSSSESSGEEEDKEEDQDHQEILATAKTEDLEEDLVEQEEDEGPVDLKICREARPRGEPECCTQRWAPVELQGLSTGEVPAAKTRERSAKQALVAKLLCRWWYVLPDWPPKDFDYTAALAEAGFRAVSVEEFEQEAELEGNLRKVFALPNGYPGLYRDEQGCLIDVRPVKGRPSYDQLMLRSKSELHKLLVLAYTRQLEVLESRARSNDLETLRQQLRQELAQAKNNVFNFFKHPQVQSA